MIYLGAALMVYNIVKYIRFGRSISRRGDWKTEHRILRIPTLLLVLFLIGYLVVELFGEPDLVIASILFGGSIYVAIMEYIMERIANRIRVNEQLEARATAAEEANTAKTVFLSNMSHDIRTPLNAILGYTALAKDAPSDRVKEYIEKIGNAGQQMLTLVNEVLEMSRVESGRLELEPVNTDLTGILTQSAELIRTQMESKNITFTVRCGMDKCFVICDGNRLRRVLMNILSNAWKFTKEGGEVSLSLEETARSDETVSCRIRVKDNGIGMSSEFVGKLYTAFERERTSTVSGIQGTGLGMAISKSIIDLMGGTIDVFTEKGKGTEFVISLEFPLGEEPEAGERDGAEEFSFAGRRALLAEDNEINREIAVSILTEAGFKVDTAENGEQALERVAASDPGTYSVILMDIQMPVMDGYTAAREIRALENSQLTSIPIIAMTANAFREDEEAAKEAGMQAHIAKPLDVGRMLRTIAEVIGTC